MSPKTDFQSNLAQDTSVTHFAGYNGLKIQSTQTRSPDPAVRRNYTSRRKYDAAVTAKQRYQILLDLITSLQFDSTADYSLKIIGFLISTVDLINTGYIFDSSETARAELAKNYFFIASRYKNIKEHDNEALNYFRLSLAQNQNYAPTYNGLGLLYEQMNNLAEAESSYKIAIGLDANYDSPFINFGLLIFRCSKAQNNNVLVNEAIWFYDRALWINPTNSIVYRNKALVYQYLKNFNFTKELLQVALSFANTDPMLYLELGVNELLQRNNNEAEHWFQEGLRVAQNNNQALLFLYINLSVIYIEQKNYEKAYLYLNLAHQLAPNDFNVIINLISTLLYQGDFLAALDFIDKGICFTNLSVTWMTYLYDKLGQVFSNLQYLAEAELAYRKALENQNEIEIRKKSYLYRCLGNVYFDEKKYLEAIESYQYSFVFYPEMDLQELIREAQHYHSHGVPQASENIIRRSLQQVNYDSQLENDITSLLISGSFTSEIRDRLNANMFIKNNKIYYSQNMGEIHMAATSYILEYRFDEIDKSYKWHRKKRDDCWQGKAQKWRVATSDGLNNFVVLFDESVRKHVIVCGRVGHYYLARQIGSRTFGTPVRFAGGVFFKNGKIIHWNNRSGHYRPAEIQASKEIGKIIGFPVEKFVSQEVLEARIRKTPYLKINYRDVANDLKDLTLGDKKVVRSFIREFGKGFFTN